MHKDDQMTPLERKICLNNGQPVDRLPISMMTGPAARQLLDLSQRDYDGNARNMAALQIKIYECFGIDEVGGFYGLSSVGKSFGAVMSDSDVHTLGILAYPIKDIHDLSLLDLERFTIRNNPIAKVCMEFMHLLQDSLGDQVPYSMGFPGAFTATSSLIGPKVLLRALYRMPEQVHQLLKLVNDGLIQLATEFLLEDIPVYIADPVASGTMIHERHYSEFVKPYATDFVRSCKKVRPYPIGCHICGDTTKILTHMADSGYDSLSLDNLVDLEVAKNTIGNRVHFSGNVPPVEVMRFGTPAQVEEAVKRCHEKAWDNPCGFTINTGCDVPYGTSLENLLTYMAAARKCAKYPYTPENFKW